VAASCSEDRFNPRFCFRLSLTIWAKALYSGVFCSNTRVMLGKPLPQEFPPRQEVCAPRRIIRYLAEFRVVTGKAGRQKAIGPRPDSLAGNLHNIIAVYSPWQLHDAPAVGKYRLELRLKYQEVVSARASHELVSQRGITLVLQKVRGRVAAHVQLIVFVPVRELSVRRG